MPDHRLTPEIETVLRASRIEGNTLTLPPGQLARPIYEKVAAFLLNCGGKWHRGRGCHVFEKPAAQAVGLALAAGVAKDEKKAKQAFYTPPELAKKVVEMADVMEGHWVLEPSAGHGALVLACLNAGATRVSCIESDPEAVAKLDTLGGQVWVTHSDFLKMPAPRNYRHKFDRVVMNPPFARGADVQHVRQALNFVAPGGRLVAIVSASRKAASFIKQLSHAYPGAVTTEPVVAGAFKESGTNVATVILTFKAP